MNLQNITSMADAVKACWVFYEQVQGKKCMKIMNNIMNNISKKYLLLFHCHFV